MRVHGAVEAESGRQRGSAWKEKEHRAKKKPLTEKPLRNLWG